MTTITYPTDVNIKNNSIKHSITDLGLGEFNDIVRYVVEEK